MSVSQVKKRFGEIESYLGRDKEALRRLKLLKDDVNVLRTSLAAAEEKAELAEVVKNAARERADKAESRLNEVMSEAERLSQVVKSLESQLATASGQRPEHEREYIEPADKEAEAKAMIKMLVKELPKCPLSFRNSKRLPEDVLWFDREEITAGWSKKSMWILGTAIATLLSIQRSIVITSNVKLTDYKKDRMPSYARPAIRWFKGNIRPDGVDEAWDRLSFEEKQRAEESCKAEDTGSVLFGL